MRPGGDRAGLHGALWATMRTRLLPSVTPPQGVSEQQEGRDPMQLFTGPVPSGFVRGTAGGDVGGREAVRRSL